MCINVGNIQAIFNNTEFRNQLVQNNRNICYERTYPVLRRLGETCRETPTADNIKLLALATYGWMPTILDNMGYGENNQADEEREQNVVNALNGVSDLDSLQDGNRIKTLKDFTNNSYVGLSKFLHFIYPSEFAIWDSNVYSALKFASVYNINQFWDILNNAGWNYRVLRQNEILVNTINNCRSKNLAAETNTRDRFFQYETAILAVSRAVNAAGEELRLRMIETSLFCLGQVLRKIQRANE